ncbi:MAG: trypsin-like peptidase domain-containing protein, partial [Actinomycetota bacterium]|nr:trypsin-like peptidase domain-containing protein [Actinomycetota bacterium]
MGSTTRRLRTDHGHRWAEIGAVGLLSAVLATGGTFAVVQATTGDDGPVVEEAGGVQQPLTASNASLGTVDDWAAVAQGVSPSVVSISVESARGDGAGSGVVWDDQGHIVTNAHVVAGSRAVQVTLADGRGYQASVVGADPSTDLALLQLTDGPEDLTPITVGDDESLAVGDPVMAIGNPLGLSGTVTTGIVSALDRPVTTQSSEADPEQGSAVV